DAETLAYLRLTGRPAAQVALVEAYAKEQGLWHDPDHAARYSEELALDLSTVVPSLAGPKRPQDRVALADAKTAFREALGSYVRAGLLPYLEKLGFNLVGYGCTTCIGNSGPLPEAISTAVADNDLTVVSVLSGNRNFEGRINPDVKMNYLASPLLVVAYALAGTMDIDMPNDPLGSRPDGTPVYLRDIWPAPADVAAVVRDAVASEMFTRD